MTNKYLDQLKANYIASQDYIDKIQLIEKHHKLSHKRIQIKTNMSLIKRLVFEDLGYTVYPSSIVINLWIISWK